MLQDNNGISTWSKSHTMLFRCVLLLPLSLVKYKLRLFLFTPTYLHLANGYLNKCWPQIKIGSTELYISTKCRDHTSDSATRKNSESSSLTSSASESPTPFITRQWTPGRVKNSWFRIWEEWCSCFLSSRKAPAWCVLGAVQPGKMTIRLAIYYSQ